MLARFRRTAPRGAAVLALAAVVAACGAAVSTPTPAPSGSPAASPTPAPVATPTPAPTFPVTIVDDDGTEVLLAAEPRRIVSLTPAVTETLFALGVGDRVVGKVEDWNLFPPEATAVPDVAAFGSVDVEAIVALEADLVIAGGDGFNPPESIDRLRALEVPVIVLDPDMETLFADVERIGLAVGRPREAAAIVRTIRQAFADVFAATSGLAPVRVFYELDASSGYFGPAPDFFGTEMLRIAGAEPLTSGVDGVYQIEAERIIAFDPEVILLADAAYGVTAAQVGARPGWDAITAVRTGAIRAIDDILVTRPGPRLAEGIRILALALRPGLELP